jgi:hypothetical protein
VLPNCVTRDSGNRFVIAADWATKFVISENRLRESLVRDVLRVIVVHRELFENYGSFILEFDRVD